MRALAGLALALTACALAACGGSGDDASAPTVPATSPPGAETGREPAPAIAGQTLEGSPVALGDFRGGPVLVNVWSSW